MARVGYLCDRPLALLAIATLAAIVLPPLLWLAYAGDLIWPGLAANFTATLLAFHVALAWDRREKQRERLDEERDREVTVRAAEESENERRKTEARRRFRAIYHELEKNRESIDLVRERLAPDPDNPSRFHILLPQLLRGSWNASSGALALIIADNDLMASLSTFYGRVEELQWRLRYRLETGRYVGSSLAGVAPAIDEMTRPLANELAIEVGDLLERVGRQVKEPTIRPSGASRVSGGGGGITTRGERGPARASAARSTSASN
jgi:hypothetical protein